MKNDFDTPIKKTPKHFGSKHKIAAVILTPLFIAAFLSIVSLRAEFYSRPQNFKFKHVIKNISNIFSFASIHKERRYAPRIKMNLIEAAIDTYLLNTNQFPKTLNDLIVDPNIAGWCGPYVYKNQLNDTWGRPYIYRSYLNNQSQPNGYIIISYGADGKPGGKGINTDFHND